VSIPNFAYWKLRLGLLLRGRMPKSPMLPFEWYNTPNIRLLTIKDFRDFARMLSIRIEKELFVEPNGQLMAPIYSPFPNWLAHLGIFVIAK
jgi:methionine biosynthesis protein MetW